MAERTLSNLRKRRGVVKASITRLETRLSAMESTPNENTVDNARQLLAKLRTYDSEFKDVHMSMIDLIEDETTVLAEQIILDNHDDLTASMTVRVQKVIASAKPAPDGRVENRRILARRLKQIREGLSATGDAVGSLTGESKHVHRLRLHEERIGDSKKDLSAIKTELMSMDLEDTDELVVKQAEIEQLLFDCSLKVKELLAKASIPTSSSSTHTSTESTGLKLPKLDVPTFNGNILQWRSFWEQFVISVHSRTTLTQRSLYTSNKHCREVPPKMR